MPIELGRKRREGDTPADRLLSCHEKIRHLARVAIDLANAVAAPPAEVAEAAAQVHRYFTVALPLHAADEETSIRPRLLEVPRAPSVAAALETMTREHREHDVVLAELVPLWAGAAEGKAGVAELARALAAARELESLLASHLELEEREIVPALRALSPETGITIVSEMKRRRGVGP